MTVAKGMKVNLFASEKEFPELAKPVQMPFDTKGRLWVAVWPSYPHWKPKEEMNDKILIFEDTNGDGKADKMTVFADHLHCPTGFEFYNGGVLVAQAPDLMFLKDTDGDDKADLRVRVLHGLDSADTHHTSNSFALDPGGALYFQEGTFHHTQVEIALRPAAALRQRRRLPLRAAHPEVRRLRHLRLRQSARPRLRPLGPGHRRRRHRRQPLSRRPVLRPPAIIPHKHAAAAAGLSAADPALPRHRDPLQPALPRGEPGQPAGRQRHRLPGHPAVQDRGQGRQLRRHRGRADPLLHRSELPPLGPQDRAGRRHLVHRLAQPDHRPHAAHPPRPQPRPHAWPHLSRHLRGPAAAQAGEDRRRADREAARPAQGAGGSRPLPRPHRAGRPRQRRGHRRREEVGRRSRPEGSGLRAQHAGSAVAAPVPQRRRRGSAASACWRRRTSAPAPRRRACCATGATACRTLWSCSRSWPPTRIRAFAWKRSAPPASSRCPRRSRSPLISAEQPTDQYLDFVRGETMKALDPHRQEGHRGQAGRSTSRRTAGARFFLKNVSTDDLLKMKRTPGASTWNCCSARASATSTAARRWPAWPSWRSKSELRVLLDAIRSQDERAEARQDESVVFDLVRLLTEPAGRRAGRGARPSWRRWRRTRKLPVTRQLGFVALIAADGDVGQGVGAGRRSRCRRCATWSAPCR